jgi:hypothetical protein
MRLAWPGVLIACVLAFSLQSPAQMVCVNAAEHRPCTESESKEMRDKICRDEPAPANLFVSHPVRLSGIIYDPSGAPIDFDSIKPDHHSIVQIKSVATGATLFAVPLRSDGQFEFEFVPEGTYRLILVWMKDGRFERLPLADQPKEMRCSDDKECRITSTIRFHGTDNPVDSCPPK